jgi:hypothetical protein
LGGAAPSLLHLVQNQRSLLRKRIVRIWPQDAQTVISVGGWSGTRWSSTAGWPVISGLAAIGDRLVLFGVGHEQVAELLFG